MSAGSGWRASLACAEAFMMAGHLAEAQSVARRERDFDGSGRDRWRSGRATSLYLQRRTEDSHAALLDAAARRNPKSAGPGTADDRRDGARFMSVMRWRLRARRLRQRLMPRLRRPTCPTAPRCSRQTAKTIALGELGHLDVTGVDGGRRRGNSAHGSAATSFLRFASGRRRSVLGVADARADPAAAEAAVDGLRDDDQPQDVVPLGEHDERVGQPRIWSSRCRRQVSSAAHCAAQRPGLPGWLAVPLPRRLGDRARRFAVKV